MLRREHHRDMSWPHPQNDARDDAVLCSLSCSFGHLQPANARTTLASLGTASEALARAQQQC